MDTDRARTQTLVESLSGKVALVFPGQGSQFVGMGKTLYDASAAARKVFDQADEVLGFSITKLCFNGPANELEDTINAQPAILTVSIAALEALKERLADAGHKVEPMVVAGHSLGEFSALVAAGVIDFPTGLKLVRERGRLMKEAGETSPGGMAAVIGLDASTLADVCNDASEGDIIIVANDNCPGQTVISGEVAALMRAMEMAKSRGAKRVARLGISIASHSPLMARAGAGLRDVISRQQLSAPQIPIVANVSGMAMTTVEDVRQELAHHVERPVNWTRSVAEMVNSGATTFVEVGPGQILSGLIRRINREVTTLSLTDLGLPGDERLA